MTQVAQKKHDLAGANIYITHLLQWLQAVKQV